MHFSISISLLYTVLSGLPNVSAAPAGINNDAGSLLQGLAGQAASFCSSYLHLPYLTTVTSTATISTTASIYPGDATTTITGSTQVQVTEHATITAYSDNPTLTATATVTAGTKTIYQKRDLLEVRRQHQTADTMSTTSAAKTTPPSNAEAANVPAAQKQNQGQAGVSSNSQAAPAAATTPAAAAAAAAGSKQQPSDPRADLLKLAPGLISQACSLLVRPKTSTVSQGTTVTVSGVPITGTPTTTITVNQEVTNTVTNTITDTVTAPATSTVTTLINATVTPILVKPKICGAKGLPGANAFNYDANFNTNQADCIASCKTDNRCLCTGFYLVTDPTTGSTTGTCRKYDKSVTDSADLGFGYYNFNDKAC